MKELYIGLMSGTSVDGIDAVLVDLSKKEPAIVATHYEAYTKPLRQQILELCIVGDDEIQRLGELDIILGKQFARAVTHLLAEQSLTSADIKAIGSHGQTVRHYPFKPHQFTMQIGDPNTIAAETGITTIADFRRKDMAHGGQGAPLVPGFHQHVFASSSINRAIVNIGGIANITLLPKDHIGPVIGFDTGPGNVLLDGWIDFQQQVCPDIKGQWAALGKVNEHFLQQLLRDPYFHKPAPKSTGREYFNLDWLQKHLMIYGLSISAVDAQTTLTELTARTILASIHLYLPAGEILVCGGGAHNDYLMSRLAAMASNTFTVHSTQFYGIDPDWVEAIAFAWLAKQTLNRAPGNLPSVTGASREAVLGGVYFA